MNVKNIKPQQLNPSLSVKHVAATVRKIRDEHLHSANTQLKKSVGFFVQTNTLSATSNYQNKKLVDLMEIARQVGEQLKKAGVKVQFEVNRDLNKIVIIVRDPVTNEVVRKIPPEDYLNTVQFLKDMEQELRLKGLEIDIKY